MSKKARIFLRISMIYLLFACGTKQPRVADEALKTPSIDHVKFTENCADCHEQDRLGPTVDGNLSIAHGFGSDCISCHSFPLFNSINSAVLTHQPTPSACMGCHSRERENATHGAFGECAQCHSFPAWKTIKSP